MRRRFAMDAIRVLEADHRKVERLFQEYQQGGGGPSDRKRRLAHDIREALSVHAAIEELHLYPVVRETLSGGDALVEEALEEHQQVKEMLAALEKIDVSDAGFDQKMTELQQDVQHHVEEEEGEIFPELGERLTAERLNEIGRKLEQAKSTAPTHPHPHAPNKPPGNVVAGAAAAGIDKVRDALSGEKDEEDRAHR
jgi:hemerythrin superfamily protein